MNKAIIFLLGFTCTYMTSKEYTEKNILELIVQYVPTSPIVVEAGAHFGEDTAKMAVLWPTGTIYAFEPLPSSYIRVEKVAKKFNNIFPFQYALSDKKDKNFFWVCLNREGASSLLKPTSILQSMLLFQSKPIEVVCYTLDSWAEENQVDKVDFMWLDMEGHELAMLKASPKILKTVHVIYTEVNYLEFREENAFYSEVKEFLESQGFEQVWWKQSRQFMKHDGPLQANVLFVRY